MLQGSLYMMREKVEDEAGQERGLRPLGILAGQQPGAEPRHHERREE